MGDSHLADVILTSAKESEQSKDTNNCVSVIYSYHLFIAIFLFLFVQLFA